MGKIAKTTTAQVATQSFVRKEAKKLEENLKEDLKEEMRKNHDEVMEKLDWLVGSIKKFGEEHTVLSCRVAEYSDQLEDHEKRIAKMEQTAH